MVLSACSPYFQSMLYNTPDRHPIVFLRDVRFHEIKALLEFMYRGEVSVDQDNLSSLLKVAEGLKIKGLAEVSDGQSQQQPQSSPVASTAVASALSRMPAVSSPNSFLENSLPQSHLSHSPMKRMASPPSTSTASMSSTSGLPKRKRIKPRRLSGSEAVPLASGLAQAVEVARSQQMAKEQAEAAAAAMIAASNAALGAAATEAAASIIKKDLDGGSESARESMDAREGEESSPTTKLDGVRRLNSQFQIPINKFLMRTCHILE